MSDASNSVPRSARTFRPFASVFSISEPNPVALTRIPPAKIEISSRWLGLPPFGKLAIFTSFFLFLAFLHSNTLSLPPYEDQAVGLWSEASFLVDTRFDYARLLWDEPHFCESIAGRKSYGISICPLFVALVMTASPDPVTSFRIGHVATLFCATVTMFVLWRLAVEYAGFARATLCSLCLATTPLFAVQTQMLGMDVPMTAISAMGTWFLVRDRFFKSMACFLVAFLCKASAIVLPAAAIAFVGIQWLTGSLPGRRRGKVAFFSFFTLLVVEYLIVRLGDPFTLNRSNMFGQDWGRHLLPIVTFLDVVLLAILVFPAGVFVFGRRVLVSRRNNDGQQRLNTASSRALLFAILALGAFIAAYLQIIMAPRYMTCPLFFLYLILSVIVSDDSGNRVLRARTLLLCLLLLFNFSNLDGRFYVDLGGARHCAVTERSREYLSDHLAVLEAFRAIEQKRPESPIFLPKPYSYYGRDPRLGYVSKPLHVIDANDMALAVNGLMAIKEDLLSGAAENPVILKIHDRSGFLPDPDLEDEVIFRDNLRVPMVVYAKELARSPSKFADLELRWRGDTHP